MISVRIRPPGLLVLAASLLVSAAGCGGRSADAPPLDATRSPAPATDAVDHRPKIVVLGDSLTAGLGLPQDESFPSLLQRRLDAAGRQFEVVNAGVSGDTSAGGVRRLDWSLQPDARVLVVALGANDGLRGLPVDQMMRNLSQIIERAQARHVLVILAGMEAPPNYGAEYATAFRQAYRDLSAKYKVTMIPFLLAGVAGDPALNQPDGIHPNPRGAQIVADTVWQTLGPALDRLSAS